jgi:hypothetical protein
VIDIQGFTDDRGLLIATTVKSLVIPRQLVFEAQRILQADKRVDTANNDPNVLKMLGRFLRWWLINTSRTPMLGSFARMKMVSITLSVRLIPLLKIMTLILLMRSSKPLAGIRLVGLTRARFTAAPGHDVCRGGHVALPSIPLGE